MITFLNNPDKLSAIISLIVAIAILIASYFQWWYLTYDGKMIMKIWMKILLTIFIIFLLAAFILILL